MSNREGYSYDWAAWDTAVREKFAPQLKKLGAYRYNNFEVFRSPQGRWMAFHNTGYDDVQVYDLETCELIATDVYSKRDPQVYASHTNASTFVPSYQLAYVGKDKTPYLSDLTELDEPVDWDSIVSIPIAFNAWTIWAADYEFDVDLLDLREIDNGIIKMWDKKTSFVIPISASHVRNWVRFNADAYYKFGPADESGVMKATGERSSDWGEWCVSFTVLEERSRDRMSFQLDGKVLDFYDMNKEPKASYSVQDNLPWEAILAWQEEQKTKGKAS